MEIRQYGDRTSTPKKFDKENFPGRTKQAEAPATDVNNIMRKFRTTGVLDHLKQGPSSYGDFSSSDDMAEQRNKIIAADRAFAELPSAIRSRFDNSPEQLVFFLADENNTAEAQHLGLLNTPPRPKGKPPEVGDPAPDEEPAPV